MLIICIVTFYIKLQNKAILHIKLQVKCMLLYEYIVIHRFSNILK